MTSPGFQAITPIAKSYEGLLIQTTQQAVEIAEAIETAAVAGKITSGRTYMGQYPDDAGLGWIVQITVAGKLYTAYQYDWLVVDDEGALSTWHGGSQWPGNNPEFADQFPIPAVEWAATSAAPDAAAEPGLTASLTVPQPTSCNAPFTYTVSQTVGGVTSDATLVGDPVLADGNATLTVGDLTVGAEYTFVVTVRTPYAGVTATSVATAPITATA